MEYGKSYAFYGDPRGHLFLLLVPGVYDVDSKTPVIDLEQPFRVIDGPVCLEGIRWWFVEYAGERGWIDGVVHETLEIRPYEE